MVYIAKWKAVLILIVCGLGLMYTAPNLLDRATVGWMEETLPDWMPNRTVNLGLDLQGGSHLLLEVEVATIVDERIDAVVDSLRPELRAADIGYVGLGRDGQAAVVTIRDAADIDRARSLITELAEDVSIDVSDDGQFRVTLTSDAQQQISEQAIQQSIEIIRRRIDETGTREPTIQAQGPDRILVQLPGVDDPERVKRLLGETAQLNFHMVDQNTSVEDARAGDLPPGSRLVPSSEDPNTEYVIRQRVAVGGDSLVDAQPTFQEGRAVVSFRFDSVGARRFGDITSENVGRPFAILLDNEVISAPVIREPILGGRGVIQGDFTTQQAQDLALLLRAGALPAPLTILEERTVGPSLGADSIAAGQTAALIGMALVLGFMVVAYGLFGIMAGAALLVNIALIFAILSALQATLTLPGIAGIVLTIGMAVDANVLIFERIREEIRNGRGPVSSIDAGYSRALTTIIDANLTTLIAAVILYALGSGPVRGFAVTLGIGICTSMFTAIMVTRLLVVTWLRQKRPAVLPV